MGYILIVIGVPFGLLFGLEIGLSMDNPIALLIPPAFLVSLGFISITDFKKPIPGSEPHINRPGRTKEAISSFVTGTIMMIIGFGGLLSGFFGDPFSELQPLQLGLLFLGIFGLYFFGAGFAVGGWGHFDWPGQSTHYYCPYCHHEVTVSKTLPDPGRVSLCPYCGRSYTRKDW